MTKTTEEMRVKRKCMFNMRAYMLFFTLYQRDILTDEHLVTIRKTFEKACKNADCKIKDLSKGPDYIYLCLDYEPKVIMSQLVNTLKGISSRYLRQDHPDILQHYYNGALWSPSYYISSNPIESIDVIKEEITKKSSRTW